MKKYKVRTYDKKGNFLRDFFTNNFRFALKLYVAETEINPDKRPTLWACNNGVYVRVHDFNFGEVTDENIEKYLQERVIEGDDLLEDIKWP